MEKNELLKLSKKFDDCDDDTVLHFGLTDKNKRQKVTLVIDDREFYNADFPDVEDYYILTTNHFQKTAIIYGSGDGIRASSPCDNIFNLFIEELGFSENDLKNLDFLGDCTKTVTILEKPEDFYNMWGNGEKSS